MASTQSGNSCGPPGDEAATAQGPAVSDLMRLVGAGPTGSILLSLEGGPLRTKELTERVLGYGPRTVYRYVEKLVAIGAIEREVEPGVPSKVVHHLTDPCGIELCELVNRFAKSLPDGGIAPHSWGCLTLLGDLWESGMFKELNVGPCTATELARADHDLSFHQVSRRTSLFMVRGLLREADDESRHRRFELTDEARQRTAVIAGLGHWRTRFVGSPLEPGLTAEETAELLRAALPLVVLPDHAGKSLKLSVAADSADDEDAVVWAEVTADGGVVSIVNPPAKADSWGSGGVGDWAKALLKGSKVRVGGNRSAIKSCLEGMHTALWRTGGPEGSISTGVESLPDSF